MSETKPCQHEPLLQLHGRTIVGTKRCRHCGLNEAYWGRTISAYAPDPRITSADEMAKAVTEAVDAYDSGDEPNWKGLVHALRAALAAYNAARPLTGQEDDRGQE